VIATRRIGDAALIGDVGDDDWLLMTPTIGEVPMTGPWLLRMNRTPEWSQQGGQRA
jgi:hypothetical protein